MVYVDNFEDTKIKFGRMRMCHMVADTKDELLEMVDKIGVQRKWIQYENTQMEHFDICMAKKKKALSFGAELVNMRVLAKFTKERDLQKYLGK